MNKFNKQPSIDEALIEMKLGAKQINRQANDSDK